MKIDRIELFHVAIPLPKPFHPAWIPGYPQTVNRFTLLRLTTDDGVQGLAACTSTPPGWVPEARDGILADTIRVAADGTGEKYFEIT